MCFCVLQFIISAELYSPFYQVLNSQLVPVYVGSLCSCTLPLIMVSSLLMRFLIVLSLLLASLGLHGLMHLGVAVLAYGG